MKQVTTNIFVALVSSFFSFLLFQHYLLPEKQIEEASSATAQLARYETLVNTSPHPQPEKLPSDFVTTSRMVTDAVVNITAFSDNDFSRSNGSGVVYSGDGYIITNHHVVSQSNRLEITLPNKRKLEGRVIGTDPTTDIALVKVEAYNLQALRFGDSDKIEVGEWVLAVGNPFNLTSTVTAGIVSAKARNLNIIRGSYSIESFIQTDAVVNPGNSGGALVNDRGELIGINTAIISESGGYEGYSFAIPSNLVRKVIRDLREFGAVQRAVLGVGIREVDDELAAELGLPSVAGVYISGITSGGGADKAGLVAGDVIVGINDVRVSSVPELQEQIARYRPGDRITVQFYRRGRLFERNNVIMQGLPDNRFSNW